MRKCIVLISVVILGLASTTALRGASLAGVTLADTDQVAGTKLVLNGLGLRTKFMVKVYVAGLYLQQKSSDAPAIIAADEPKRLVMQFLHGVSKDRLADAFDESFNANSPDAKKTMGADIARLLGSLEAVKPGDQMFFTYLPGTGTTFALNGRDKLTIAGPAFGKIL